MGRPILTEALKRYDIVVFLAAETHSGANPSYAGAEWELTGSGRRSVAVVQKGGLGSGKGGGGGPGCRAASRARI
jgi:hypothetical protein